MQMRMIRIRAGGMPYPTKITMTTTFTYPNHLFGEQYLP